MEPKIIPLKRTDLKRLHLGCGSRHLPGYYHIDAMDQEHVDQVHRVDRLDFIASDSVQRIYCSHVLEHFDRFTFEDVLREWFRVLAPGGVLRLAVPDFAACAKVYYEEGLQDGLTGLIGLICGGQRGPYDYHKMIFDEPFLARALKDVGFRETRRWDWRTTDHADVDDYSQAHLPHMDKENGLLMSLNLEAVK